jgi:hypothetical protein
MTEDDEIAKRRARMWAAVGTAISTWALMEGGLVWLLTTLLRIDAYPDKAGVILYSINNFPTWLTIIDELMVLDTKLSDHRSQWNKLDSRLRALNDTRVRLAHHTAMGVDHSEVSLRPPIYDVRTKSNKYSPLDEDEIREFIKKVGDVSLQLMRLIEAIQNALGTSPDKSNA